jgi:hypothetical protein
MTIVPFGGLQIVLLHCQEHEGNDVFRECVCSCCKKLSASLTRYVYS